MLLYPFITCIFKRSERDLGLEVVYDVSHNTAKIEEYTVVLLQQKNGQNRVTGKDKQDEKGR